MNEVTIADILAFIGIAALFAANMAQFILSGRGRGAEAQANEADAIESLTMSVNSLHSKVQELEAKLDTERMARRIAEAKFADLQRRFVILENDNRLLVMENAALIDALKKDKE